MRCPFCAEEIQESAILCRFCGASKAAGEWTSPGRGPISESKPHSLGNAALPNSSGSPLQGGVPKPRTSGSTVLILVLLAVVAVPAVLFLMAVTLFGKPASKATVGPGAAPAPAPLATPSSLNYWPVQQQVAYEGVCLSNPNSGADFCRCIRVAAQTTFTSAEVARIGVGADGRLTQASGTISATKTAEMERLTATC